MVSNASDDFPEPLSPVITVSVFRGISTLMFFRLCWRAPRTVMFLMAIVCGLVLQFRGQDLQNGPEANERSGTPVS